MDQGPALSHAFSHFELCVYPEASDMEPEVHVDKPQKAKGSCLPVSHEARESMQRTNLANVIVKHIMSLVIRLGTPENRTVQSIFLDMVKTPLSIRRPAAICHANSVCSRLACYSLVCFSEPAMS